MARIYPLFSSSSGNSTYIGNQKSGILVDAGVSCKRLCNALSTNELSPSAIQGIFITHTHSDHISGLKVFLKKYDIPLYAQKTNLEIMLKEDRIPQGIKIYETGSEDISIGDFSLKAFETPHDTPASCGYRITAPDGKTAVICTDLGEITDTVSHSLKGADIVLLESNYDENMLRNGMYPYPLKQRIASDHGHLSNSDCAKTLCSLVKSGTNKFVLGHLSPHNNTSQLAESSALSGLSEFSRNKDYILDIARPDGNGMVVAF